MVVQTREGQPLDLRAVSFIHRWQAGAIVGFPRDRLAIASATCHRARTTAGATRGDAGFGVPWMYEACESAAAADVGYTFGLAANPVLKKAAEPVLQRAVEQFAQSGEPARGFDQFLYRAGTWKNPRRVIVKAECPRLGTNLRFSVTDRPGAEVVPEAAYEDYAERGESENRNKELQTERLGDRLSCHRFLANYFRLMLHAAAWNLLVRLRRVVADRSFSDLADSLVFDGGRGVFCAYHAQLAHNASRPMPAQPQPRSIGAA